MVIEWTWEVRKREESKLTPRFTRLDTQGVLYSSTNGFVTTGKRAGLGNKMVSSGLHCRVCVAYGISKEDRRQLELHNKSSML